MLKLLYKINYFIYKCFSKINSLGLMKILKKCGKNVKICSGVSVKGANNITIGNNVVIGENSVLWSTKANLIIGNYVFTGPNVTIITGDHTTNVIGKMMYEISDNEKNEDDDLDVIIEDDVWIGANVTILKGVKIGKGSVIAAGAVVTKDTEEYTINGGVPARKIKNRFNKDELVLHKRKVEDNYGK